MDWNQFQWTENGKVVLTSCFELVATSVAPLAQGAPGFVRFYQEFIRRFGSGLTAYSTGTMTSWRKPNAKALQMVPSWLAEPKNLANPDFSIEFHSGPSVVEMASPSLRLSFDKTGSYISMTIPPDLVENDAAAALELVRAAVRDDFALAAGWGGYSMLWNTSMGPLVGEPQQKLGAWLKRHPGLGHGDNFAIFERALHGISNVNWLTLLGAELTARKGGREAIAAALGPDFTVHPMGKGVCIQAGPLPQIGDVNRGDNLPLYHRVGAYLSDLRTHEPPRFLDGLEDEATEEWFARFDS